MLAVNEVFGATIQGEGKNIGMPCFFLRLAGCNLHCVWCDTPYTWDWTGRNGKVYDPKIESRSMSVDEVFDRLETLQKEQGKNVSNLVISGGEPMLQQKSLMNLIYILKSRGWWIEIETAGTIAPMPHFTPDLFTVSLKLSNSGNDYDKRHIKDSIQAFARDSRSIFKFVVSSMDDFLEIDTLVAGYSLKKENVFIMPEGINSDTIQKHAQSVAQETIKRGWKLTTRMQILLYGNKRGI